MSKFEKAKERILGKPKDYTYTEARYLLGKMGFDGGSGAFEKTARRTGAPSG